jgi:hypothetical protein
LFFEGEISGELFFSEIEFARLFKFDNVSTFGDVRRKLSQKSEEVASVLSNAVNHSFIENQVRSP